MPLPFRNMSWVFVTTLSVASRLGLAVPLGSAVPLSAAVGTAAAVEVGVEALAGATPAAVRAVASRADLAAARRQGDPRELGAAAWLRS